MTLSRMAIALIEILESEGLLGGEKGSSSSESGQMWPTVCAHEARLGFQDRGRAYVWYRDGLCPAWTRARPRKAEQREPEPAVRGFGFGR